ncbi:unnamed protein product [Cuscuta campestris]|uniref:Uncharacterized protein n=1 Tax=Cuscuta campestris TaxID=132261 RepID=A0A484NRP7_9ASTE|nr:unnamed protein product [Cuscuta campestris]
MAPQIRNPYTSWEHEIGDARSYWLVYLEAIFCNFIRRTVDAILRLRATERLGGAEVLLSPARPRDGELGRFGGTFSSKQQPPSTEIWGKIRRSSSAPLTGKQKHPSTES